ncbi:MAG TPA: hypothetical protein VI854_04735 [Acidimicrobiia bacterium]|nr:hypothetical protein [Acidimicrobiia bacterium]
MERSCENCGIPDDELILVRRVYLDPARPGEVDRVEDGAELWCLSCASQYPFEPADG